MDRDVAPSEHKLPPTGLRTHPDLSVGSLTAATSRVLLLRTGLLGVAGHCSPTEQRVTLGDSSVYRKGRP